METNHLGILVIDGCMLKCFLKKEINDRVWTGFRCLKRRSSSGIM
jgi:hypothetical protein